MRREADPMTNVTAAETPDQPDHFAAIAVELRRAADDIETLVGSGLPMPSYVALDIHPGGRGRERDDNRTARAVDALGRALLGQPGTAQKMYDGSYHYGTQSIQRGPITVHVYDSVSTDWAVPRAAAFELAAREAQLEKLRAEVAELRAAAGQSGFVDGPCEDSDCPNASWPHSASSDLVDDPTGMGYSREADDPTPVSPARMPLHTGGMVGPVGGGELVDETEPEPPVHLEIAGAKVMCGLAIIDLDTGHGWTNDHAAVTCKACIDQAPF
jgi:hypothetical protein